MNKENFYDDVPGQTELFSDEVFEENVYESIYRLMVKLSGQE